MSPANPSISTPGLLTTSMAPAAAHPRSPALRVRLAVRRGQPTAQAGQDGGPPAVTAPQRDGHLKGLAGEQFGQFGRIGDQHRRAFFQEPVASCGVGAVHAAGDGRDVPGNGFGVVGGVQRP